MVVVVPLTVRSPIITVLPPMFTFPPIPTPPEATKEPDDTEFDWSVAVAFNFSIVKVLSTPSESCLSPK